MKKLEEYDESLLKNNPWAFSLKIEATEVTDYKRHISEQQEDGHTIQVPDKYYLDRTPSTKVFMTVGVKEKVYGLSERAKCLYLYLLYNLKQNKDYVQINQENYMLKNNIKSVNTFKEAKKELINADFILPASTYKTVFWINPNYIFPGSRTKKYEHAIDKKGEK